MWDLLKYEKNTAIIDELGDMATYGELASLGDGLAEAIGDRCLIVSSSSSTVHAFCRSQSGSHATLYIFLRLIAPIFSSLLIIRYTVAVPMLGSIRDAR